MSSPARSRRRRQLREAVRCPDCRSNVRRTSPPAGLEAADASYAVEHDTTCPWWRAHGAQPFTAVQVVAE